MTTTTEKMKETGRTPSMFASLTVLGVMVALILLSVVFFGGEVAEGPLQVSMTLATLLALSVAYYYGFRGSLISHAIANSLSGVMGTIFVILAIGTVIGTLYLTGTVANIIYYGVAIISARFYYLTVFLITLALSFMLGSSLTSVGAVGVAFVGLSSIMGVDPAITAGAAVAGGIMGNKTAKISDTVSLTVATVGGVTVDEQVRRQTSLNMKLAAVEHVELKLEDGPFRIDSFSEEILSGLINQTLNRRIVNVPGYVDLSAYRFHQRQSFGEFVDMHDVHRRGTHCAEHR